MFQPAAIHLPDNALLGIRVSMGNETECVSGKLSYFTNPMPDYSRPSSHQRGGKLIISRRMDKCGALEEGIGRSSPRETNASSRSALDIRPEFSILHFP
jgi:hypothetical protein